MKTAGIIIAIVGLLGCLLGVLGLIGTLISPVVAHVSPDEMIPGFIGGAACCGLSAVPLIGGIILVMMAPKAEETE